MATVEELIFKLTAETQGLRREMADVRRSVDKAMSESTKSVNKLNQALKKTKPAAGAAGGGMREAGRSAGGMAIGLGTALKPLLALTAAYMGLRGAMTGAKHFIETADKAQLLKGRLSLVTKNSEELSKVWDELGTISNETFTLIEGNVEVFQRMALFIDESVASTEQLLGVTKLISQSIGISGTTAQEAAGGLIQFSQALAANRLSGQEMNSVSEQMPRLLRAIIDGVQELAPEIGLTTENFRELAQEGILGTQLIMLALEGQMKKVDDEFAGLPRTVSRAMAQLSNDVLRSFDDINNATGATNTLVDAIDNIRLIVISPEFQEFLGKIVQSFADLIDVTVTGEGPLIAMKSALVGISETMSLLADPISVLIDLLGLLAESAAAVVGPLASAQLGTNENINRRIAELSGTTTPGTTPRGTIPQFHPGAITFGDQITPTAVRREEPTGTRSLEERQAILRAAGIIGADTKADIAVRKQLTSLKDQNAVLQLISEGKTKLAEKAKIQLGLERSIERQLTSGELATLDKILDTKEAINNATIVQEEVSALERELLIRQTLRDEGEGAAAELERRLDLESDLSGTVLPEQERRLNSINNLLREQSRRFFSDDLSKSIEAQNKRTKAILQGIPALEELQREEARLATLRDQGIQVGTLEHEQMLQRLRDIDNLLIMNKELADQQVELARLQEELGDTIAHSFEDAILSGEKLSDVIKQLEQDLLRLLFRSLVTDPLSEILTGAVGGGGGGGALGGIVGGFLKGAKGIGSIIAGGGNSPGVSTGPPLNIIPRRAGGGPIFANVPTLVGERGVEIIESSMSGNVIPNNKIGQFGETKINININVPQGMDPRGFRKVAGSLAGDIGRQIANGSSRN